jgi:hypothetical protein
VLIFNFAVFGLFLQIAASSNLTVINSHYMLSYPTIPVAPPNSQPCCHVPHIVQSLPVSKYCSEVLFFL